ncbi:MAG: serine/threonine-protein phosphatase [Propionibacteriaceae bacterium]|jgi:serine/threonine protein phosphatase PrpC|nr:serine/threonine-protein phosphatase [Propionibacteriaceae bacterium]
MSEADALATTADPGDAPTAPVDPPSPAAPAADSADDAPTVRLRPPPAAPPDDGAPADRLDPPLPDAGAAAPAPAGPPAPAAAPPAADAHEAPTVATAPPAPAADPYDVPTAPMDPPSRDGQPGVIWQAGGSASPPSAAAAADPDLAWPVTCAQCGAVVDADGYCTQCGARAPRPRDHYTEAPAAWVGGVCDIGRHHDRNEDALALAATKKADGGAAVLVVCDGVTTSQDSDVASLAAARRACQSLWQSNPAAPAGLGFAASKEAAVAQALKQAIRAADDAVVAATAPDTSNPASATIAVAWLINRQVYSVNLGDSRVYWFPDAGQPRLLSEDHSLAQAQIDEGVSRSAAEASALAHTITPWLGRDSGRPEPTLAQWPLDEAGWVLVCSDGLWNYASTPEDLGAVLAAATAGGPAVRPVDLAERLTAWANRQGGHDNVTVALARFDI